MTVLSDIIDLILTSTVVKYHIELYMAGLKYLPLATNSPDSMISPPMVLFSWRVYGENENSTI